MALNHLWIFSLNAIFIIGQAKEVDIYAVSTGVEAKLEALNTTALQLTWDSQPKPENITIHRYEIIIENQTLETVESNNETDSYSYTIAGLEPGFNYNVTLVVIYSEEFQDTTVAVPDTSTGSSLFSDLYIDLLNYIESEQIQSNEQKESIFLFNNTYPEIPRGVSLTSRDEQTLTFTWYQEGQADTCYIWTDEDNSTSDCSFHANETANGTITDLPVAGRNYTVYIVAVSGGLNSSTPAITYDRTLPSQPDNVTCFNASSTLLQINITSSPETHETEGYHIIYYVSDTDNFQNITAENTDTSTIADLEILDPGYTYVVEVFAQTSGLESRGATKTSCQTVVPMPANVELHPVDTSTLRLTWERPTDADDNLLIGFNITWNKNITAFVNAIVNETQYNYNITDLAVPGMLYQVKISAHYLEIGSSQFVDVTQITYPAAPTDVTMTERTSHMLIYTWNQMGVADTCYVSANDVNGTCGNLSGTFTATLDNLPVAGSNYTVTIETVSGELSNLTVVYDRTLPPNPSAPECTSKTTNSLTFTIPVPYSETLYELDGYEFIIQSLTSGYQHDTNGTVAADESQEVTVPINNLTAGVTYNITLITKISSIQSSGSNSSNCITELNIPLINDFIDTTETTIEVGWQEPDGYFEGFNLTCTGQNSAKNISAIRNRTATADAPVQHLAGDPVSETCYDTTAGALYEVNVASLVFNPPSASNSSESVFNVTVPYAPKTVAPSNATMNVIDVSVEYGYVSVDSQCTHYEVSDSTQVITVPADESKPITFEGLRADSLYNMSIAAVSNYTQHSPANDMSLWRRSYNSTPTSAWTLAPSVSGITQLERGPWSLLVQFNQTDPHDHVWQYMIHVDTDWGRIKTIKLTCDDASGEIPLTTFNCDTNSNVSIETSNTTCWKQNTCTSTTGIPEVTQVGDVTLVTEATQVQEVTLVTDVMETTDVPVVGHTETEALTTVSEVGGNAPSVLEDKSLSDYNSSQVLSICYNISDLEPYIYYSISVQAVNPGGCSLKETVTLLTDEWIPGCVNITYMNESYDSVELHWNPPDKPNGVIKHYIISYTKQDSAPSNVTTSDTFYILKPLDPYVYYNITVAAETGAGIGEVFGCPFSTTSARTHIGQPHQPSLNVFAGSATSINISWTLYKEERTGPETYYNLTVTDTQNDTWIIEEHVPGFYNRSVIVDGLDEYWNYSVKIVAYTIDENANELTTDGTNVEYVRTLESIPGPVEFLNATSLSYMNQCNATRIEWTAPSERDKNGIITGYQVEWSKIGVSESRAMNFSENYGIAEVPVEPNGLAYDITIRAMTTAGLGSLVHTFLNSTGFCRPAPVNAEQVFFTDDTSSTSTFTVTYDPTIFRENPNGPVIASALLVAEESANLNYADGYGKPEEIFNGTSWSEAIDVSPIPEYRPTPSNWLDDSSGSASRIQRRALSGKYVVGKNGTCSKDNKDYCNGPLPSGRNFRVRGIICTQMDQCYKTNFTSFVFVTKPVTEVEDMGWIAGVVIGMLALIALIAFLVYFFVFRSRHYESESSGKRDDDIGLVFPAQEISKPVRVCDFPDRVVEMHRNSDLEFNDEYQTVQSQSPKRSWTAAEKPQNRVKNRFVNILPFDHSRVTLKTVSDDDSESDYINANYIPSTSGIREYIACQGPLQCTVDDFWQMIWEQNCRVIVMLTNLREKGREKCAQYWPEEINDPSFYRSVSVNLISVSHMDYYVIRRFNVSVGKQIREVLQFHFTTWPDFGVPTEPEKLMNFVREVRSCAGNSVDPPMVVHCSAGVGRTGTFIVLDRLLREIPVANTIDIFGMVLNLRDNRCLMVQTEAQYVFIHDCMKLEIERTLGNQAYEAYDENSFTNEPVYQNSNELYYNNEAYQTFK